MNEQVNFKNWGEGIDPPERLTEERVQEMIDAAIRRHNRNASIISMCVGWVVLALFAEGLLRLIGVIPPVMPWLNITLN
jgi:predicted nucleic acid-binding Zn ribbon protein